MTLELAMVKESQAAVSFCAGDFGE